MADGPDGASFVLNNGTRHAVFDQFRNCAAIERNNRRATSHGFDNHQSEGSGQSIGTISAMARLKNSFARGACAQSPRQRHATIQ